MRPNTVIAQREGSLDGVEHKMTFDENSVAHLMSVLTDLYSDPEGAVIREYSTNALDSQIAAGVTRPIEVTTPNPLSPFFKVKDYGLGMDEDDIQNIYSKYGASTKRNSDSVVGMLGLGCKSALTYTQQFTLNSVKNGMKYMVAISRTEDGSGVMEIIDASPTDEPNGVEVIVPVKRGNGFQHKSDEFYRFWAPGTVLVNGKAPAPLVGKHIADGVMLVKDTRTDYIVMGNVPYPLSGEHSLTVDGSYYRSYGIVATVNIGDVNFTPSREALHYTRRTEATIATIRNTVKERLVSAVQEDIDAQDDEMAAFHAYYAWRNLFGGYSRQMPSEFNYKGTEIPLTVQVPGLRSFAVNSARYAVNSHSRLELKDFLERPVIFGYENEKVAGAHREKMREWRRQSDTQSTQLYLANEKPELPDWLPVEYVSWEDVRAVKPPKKDVTPRQKPQFEVYADGKGSFLEKDEISKTRPIMLIIPKDKPQYKFLKALTELRPDVMIVVLAKARWDAFKKTHTNCTSYTEYIPEMVKSFMDALDEDDKMFLGMDYYDRRTLSMLDENKIDDPTLVKLIPAAKGGTPSDRVNDYVKAQSIRTEIPTGTRDNRIETSYPLENYPLISGGQLRNGNAGHATLYINAVYAAK